MSDFITPSGRTSILSGFLGTTILLSLWAKMHRRSFKWALDEHPVQLGCAVAGFNFMTRGVSTADALGANVGSDLCIWSLIGLRQLWLKIRRKHDPV